MKEQEVIKRLNFHKEYARLSSNRVVISETDLETVLSMLKQNSAELAEKSAEIEKKDKQIDLMAKYLAINGVERDICNEKRIKENCKNVTVDNITVHRCKECIKQYFERKVEEC